MFIFLFFIAASVIVFRKIFVRRKGPTLWNEPPEITELHNGLSEHVCRLTQEKLKIRTKDGLILCARYFPAATAAKSTVVLVHGYRGNGLHDHAHNVTYYLSKGYNVLLPDNRAHGDSEGRYICFGALEADDVLDWCRLMADEYGNERLLLHGISMGAAIVLIACASDMPQLCGGVADCAFTSGGDIFAYVARNILNIPAKFILSTVVFALKLRFRADLLRISPIEAVKKAAVPLLFIHGTADNFVPTVMSCKLYDACTSKKRLLLFESARHAESFQIAPKRYYSEIACFMSEVGM